VTDYAALLRELAVPRLVGTPNHRAVREILKRELTARGFTIEEHAFSGRPARALMGVPAEVRGVNLIATRAARPPNRPPAWLVAHYDSKGQPISMAVRLAGFVALVAGLMTVFFFPLAAAVLLIAAFAILLQNRVTDDSPGAVDNATAVIAALMTVDLLQRSTHVGIVFPDAEEFGLIGARALVAERAELFAGAAVVNLDGLDDGGRSTAFLHRPGPLGRAIASAVAARRWRWLPVVVDGIVLARVAGECVTILKGTLTTMRIIHTPHDRAERLTLAGARTVAEGLARVLSGA
jgi:hypothetical protein